MSKHSLLFSSLLFLTPLLFAQQKTSFTTNIYFETASAELSTNSCKTLDSLTLKTLQSGDYELFIAGFTDSDGNDGYNQKLSEQRSDAVAKYLLNKGLEIEKTVAKAFGESQNENAENNENQKAQLRRVEITAILTYYSSVNELLQSLDSDKTATFEVMPQKDTVLYLAEGTIITIPANAFCFEDGTFPTQNITIKTIEAYQYADMMEWNLHTTSNERLLESGGMLNITASSESKPLKLRKNTTLPIQMPTQKGKDDMQLFNSTSDAQGNINWVATGQRTNLNLARGVEPSTINLDMQCLKAYKAQLSKIPKLPKLVDLPQIMAKPDAPRPPRKPVERVYETPSKPIAEMSRRELRAWKKVEKRINADKKQYASFLKMYQNSMLVYEKNKKHYENVTYPAYTASLTAFKVAVHQRENQVKAYLEAYSVYDATVEIIRIQRKVLKMKIHPYTNLTFRNLYDYGYDAKHTPREHPAFSIGKMAFKDCGKYIDLDYVYGKKEKSSSTGYELEEYKGKLAYLSLVRAKIKEVGEKTGLDAIHNDLVVERESIVNKERIERINNGTASVNEIQQYAFELNELGWINCDRFYNIPEAEKMIVKVVEKGDARCFIAFKKMKSLMHLSSVGEVLQSQKIPKQQPISVVGVKVENGKPQFARLDVLTGDATTAYQLTYTPCTAKELFKKMTEL